MGIMNLGGRKKKKVPKGQAEREFRKSEEIEREATRKKSDWGPTPIKLKKMALKLPDGGELFEAGQKLKFKKKARDADPWGSGRGPSPR